MSIQIHITYEMYRGRGFFALDEDRFPMYIRRAGKFVESITFGRIKWVHTPPSTPDVEGEATPPPIEVFDDPKESNILGICELAELFFRNEAAVGENGASIISFTNEGYRETYEGGARAGSGTLFDSRLERILQAYFTIGQLSRRMYRGDEDG